MNPRSLSLVFGLFLAGLLLSAARPVRACSCLAQSFEQASRSACAIFEGLVVAIEPVEDEGDLAPMHYRVRLRATETWTPGLAEEIVVTTAASSAACGYPFEVGHSYLVYADGGNAETPAVSLCGGTKPREQASEDKRRLGMGVVPVSPSQPTAASSTSLSRGGCAGCSIGSRASENTTSAMTFSIMTLAWLWSRRCRRA